MGAPVTLLGLLVVGAAVIGCAADPAAAGGQADDAAAVAPTVPWRELHYSAHKLIFSASSTLTVSELSADAARSELRELEGGLVPQGPVVRVRTDSELPLGIDETVTVWLDAASGTALQREKTVTGRKHYFKLARYTADGYLQWRSEPADAGEEKLGPESWSARNERRLRWEHAGPTGAPVTDPYALLYLLSVFSLRPGDGERLLMVPADDGLVELRFTVAGVAEAEADFATGRSTEMRQRRGRLIATRLVVTAHDPRTGAADEDADTGFMGMRGGLEVLVEEGTGLPVEVSGRSKGIGRVVVRLDRAELGE